MVFGPAEENVDETLHHFKHCLHGLWNYTVKASFVCYKFSLRIANECTSIWIREMCRWHIDVIKGKLPYSLIIKITVRLIVIYVE